MFHAYIVEVGEEAVGVVARETNGYRFYAAKQSFRSLEGRSSSPAPKTREARRSICAGRLVLSHPRSRR